jgi:hypothetical protein
MYNPNLLNVPNANQIKELRYDGNKLHFLGGLNIEFTPSQIQNTQSPYIKNLWANNRGTLSKMPGLSNLFENDISQVGVKGIHKTLYKGKKVFALNTRLYAQEGEQNPVVILEGLNTTNIMTFTELNGVLYGVNGNDFISYDGTTATKNPEGYIPTLVTMRRPNVKDLPSETSINGGGFTLEEFNLLSNKFKINFTADGTNNEYYMPSTLLPLDNVAPTVNVYDDFTQEVTGISIATWDHTTGKITLDQQVQDGYTVEITWQKTNEGYYQRISHCKYIYSFNGLWFAGNTDSPQFIRYSDTLNGLYIPDTYYLTVGGKEESTTGFANIYNNLIAFKEKSTYIINTTDEGLYIAQLLNDSIGCDCPYTICNIDNSPVFLSSVKGVCTLTNTYIKSEKNIQVISDNVNGNIFANNPKSGIIYYSKVKLEQEQWVQKMKLAQATDWYGKYWLNIDDKTWVLDYNLIKFNGANERSLCWYYRTNIKSSGFCQDDTTLYYGVSDRGNIAYFSQEFNDFGEAIESVFTSKLYDFELPDYYKTVHAMWLTMSPTRTGINFNYYDENLNKYGTRRYLVKASNLNYFSFNRFSFDKFTFKGKTNIPKNMKIWIKAKRIAYFQFEIKNNEINENIEIVNFIIQYQPQYKIKELL